MLNRIVIIGASAAGLRTAARAKRLLPETEIVVLDREEVISYGACGLPYFVAGDIDRIRALRATAWGTLRDPEFFLNAKALDVRIGAEVKSIDREAKKVTYLNLADDSEVELAYDKLVIATGATSKWLPGVDKDHPRVSVFKTPEDAKRWRKSLETNELDSIAIIGAGFIGIELAEAFKSMWGCEVDLIEGFDTVLPAFLDPEMAAIVESHLKEQGVRVHTGALCQSLEEDGDKLKIITNKGVIETQHAICAIGFAPVNELAKQAGLEVGPTGGIRVDEYLATNDPDIYAAGDCIEVTHKVSGKPAYVPLGSLANRQGRAVGDTLAGRGKKFGPVVGSGVAKVFDITVASTGLSETNCKRNGIETESVWGSFSDKAHYYPEDKPIYLKMIYRKSDGKLLGLQGAGPGDVVKRVDVFGNLLLNDGCYDDLLDLEFCYAPPYAPAIDPLYVLGCVASNQSRDGVVSLPPLASMGEFTIVDVRTAGESEGIPIQVPGVLAIPIEELRARVEEVPKDKPVMVVCMRGPRSGEAARILSQAGVKSVVYLGGGMAMRR